MKSRTRKAADRIRKHIKKIRSAIRVALLDTISIPVGENCLTDNILERHGQKSVTTPYSHGRTNLDYAIKLEKEKYVNLLKHDYLSYDKAGAIRVVRNTNDFESDDIFVAAHRRGFEFTHHDVINNTLHRRSFRRKIKRLAKCRRRKNCNFYYHYRFNKNMDLERIFHKAEIFISFYKQNSKKCTFNIFTQELVGASTDRDVRMVEHNGEIRAFIFRTKDIWTGEDQDLFWARNDDDLFRKMFIIIENLNQATRQG